MYYVPIPANTVHRTRNPARTALLPVHTGRSLQHSCRLIPVITYKPAIYGMALVAHPIMVSKPTLKSALI